MGLADGSGAWWFRYLLTNPGRDGCAGNPGGMPVQVWATWFPSGGIPQSFIQEFPRDAIDLTGKGKSPFHFRVHGNGIDEDSCRGALEVDGHAIAWNLHYRSTFRVTLSDKGWIGFSRTPHSDAVVSGQITLDGRSFAGDPLGFGVQGHNCGYRHRNFWTWAHAVFASEGRPVATLEALVYEMPFGLVFRKVVLWHDQQQHVFRKMREATRDEEKMQWKFGGVARDGVRLEATLNGRGSSKHRLPYVKTDCSGTFDVSNNSLASASMLLENPKGSVERFETTTGAVLEMVG
jgi:hypothetical protein